MPCALDRPANGSTGYTEDVSSPDDIDRVTALDVVEHLHYFLPESITRFLERAGFDVMCGRSAYKPMAFDHALTQLREYNPIVFRAFA